MGDPATSAPGEQFFLKWGVRATTTHHHTAALRASLGHPEPFTLRYVEIGNEVESLV